MPKSPAVRTYRLTLGAERPAPRLHDYTMPSRYPELPFDEPAEGTLQIDDKRFVLSGIFPSDRKAAEEAILQRGGIVEETVNYRTHCVIVGELPSRGWKYGNYGNKINEALELKRMYSRPVLLREASWLAQIRSPKTTEQHLDELPYQRERSIWLLHSFERGYTDGWACCLPAAFRTALDIQQTSRVELGEDRLTWTQGCAFNFAPGDTIHDSREAYEKSWAEALQTMGFSMRVVGSTPEAITFDVFVPDEERKAIVLDKRHRAAPLEFVRLLITGSCRELE